MGIVLGSHETGVVQMKQVKKYGFYLNCTKAHSHKREFLKPAYIIKELYSCMAIFMYKRGFFKVPVIVESIKKKEKWQSHLAHASVSFHFYFCIVQNKGYTFKNEKNDLQNRQL